MVFDLVFDSCLILAEESEKRIGLLSVRSIHLLNSLIIALYAYIAMVFTLLSEAIIGPHPASAFGLLDSEKCNWLLSVRSILPVGSEGVICAIRFRASGIPFHFGRHRVCRWILGVAFV